MVMPAKADTQPAPTPPPSGRPSAPQAPSEPAAAAPSQPPVAGGRPAAPRRGAGGYQCPQCRELLPSTTASCWRCGTPNPALARRKASQESQSAIKSALEDMKRDKKRSWFRKRR